MAGLDTKKLVLKLDLHNDKEKQKAMKAVSGLPGVDSISMDMKERKLTVIGDVNPVTVVSKLRKNWPSTAILSVGPAKEPVKKKEGQKKDPDTMPVGGQQRRLNEQLIEYMRARGYHPYPPIYAAPQYVQSVEENPNSYAAPRYVQSVEENPNSCAIC